MCTGGTTMIFISGNPGGGLDPSALSETQREIYMEKQASPHAYRYPSEAALRFELRLREKLAEASYALRRSGATFAVFEESRCNEAYWRRNSLGGFVLKNGVSPLTGIQDIFDNGRLYAFECATAMVIVLYKAVSECIQPEFFNELFANLVLYTWEYDKDLRLIGGYGLDRSFVGDILYFRNPDVSSETPWWRGENAVKLGPDRYYGHGIGIRSKDEIIAALNRHRESGSTRSAYLTDQFHHPDFEYLRQFEEPLRAEDIYVRLGSRSYIS